MTLKKLTLFALIVLGLAANLRAADVIKIGFGPKGAPTTGYNIMASASGPNNPIVVGVPQALKDTTGATTGITITQITGTAYQQGAPSPATDQTVFTYNVPSISKYFSANICYSWAYNFNAATDFVIAGFSPTDEIELNILSSRGANGATAYTTSRLCSFTATGSGAPVVVSNYQPGGNYSNIATLTGLHPDANGKITLTVESATGATLMNAMRIARVAANGQVIATSSSTLSSFNYAEGNGPSANQTFTVNGSLLTADVTVNASTNYEISTDGITYSSSSLNLVQSNGTLAATTIYVRLKANAIIGTYNENITIQSAGATTRNVACSGSVTSSAIPPPPVNMHAAYVIKIGFGSKGAPTTGYNIMGSLSSPNNPIVVNVPQALKDTTGANTGITITQTTGFAYQQGAPSPATDQTVFSYNVPSISKYFSANICYSFCYNFNASTTFEIAGFATTDVIELNILSSRGANGATPYTTSRLCSFTATGAGTPVVVSDYQPGGNYSNIATLAGLTPDINGKITLTIASATGATLMNAMRIARVPGTPTSLATTNDSYKLTAIYNNGKLLVGNYNGVVRLFDFSGKKIVEGQAITGAINVNLQKGIYIVKTSTGTTKFAVN